MEYLNLRDDEQSLFLNAARLAANWLNHTQNTERHPWTTYRVAQSADNGRFLEKMCPAREDRMPAGVWLSGLYLCGLTAMDKTPVLNRDRYGYAVECGARFLKSLQCFDTRWPKAIGGFHEVWPGHSYSAPRDAATGAFGLVALYEATGDKDLLDRAIRFGQWYKTHGSDPDGYPWDDFNLETGEGTSHKRGDWQAGGTLIYWMLWTLTGDEAWKAPLKRALDVLLEICANDPGTDTAYTFHGDNIISIGNDDFATTALMAGYKLFGDERYRDLAAHRLRAELVRQAPSGAFPGYGGTFVTALELLEALAMALQGMEILTPDEIREPLLKAARHSLLLQETVNPDRYVHGGVYGESNYGQSRDVIHGRDTGYAIQLWLRLAGYRAPTYEVVGRQAS